MVSYQCLNFEERVQMFQNLLPVTNNKIEKRKLNKNDHFKTNDSSSTEPDSGYTCDLCGKNFQRDTQYFGHLQTHSGERQWTCDKCINEVNFEKHSELRCHEQKYHYQSREYSCSENGCNKKYSRPSRLEYHIRRDHRKERSYSCQLCDKNFFIVTDLKYHLNTHLGTNKKVCETCGKSFNHSSNFLRHIRKHQGIKPYQCQHCNKRFSEITILKKHNLTHRYEKRLTDNVSRKFYCAVCGETFQYVVDLRQHEMLHEKDTSINCKSCSIVLSTLDEFKVHECGITSNENEVKDIVNDLSVLIDDKLDSNSSTTNLNSDWTHIMNGLLNELNIELETQEDNMLQSNNDNSNFDSTEFLEFNRNENVHLNNIDFDYKNRYSDVLEEEIKKLQDLNKSNLNSSEQDINSKTQNEKTSIKNKMIKLKIHDEIVIKQNICKICGREFAHESSMYRHLKNHSSKKVKCNFCDRMLNIDSLQNHIRRIHKKERNFVCSLNYCNKVFFKKSDLEIHQRTHTNERPYECRICSKPFNNLSHQLRHEKTHTKHLQCEEPNNNQEQNC